MRVLIFGRYDHSYSRNAVIKSGLQLSGVEVLQCRVSPSARLWPFRLLLKYLYHRPNFDVMLVAFPGQEAMLLARLLTRKPIIFDAFTSHYEGYVRDRKAISEVSLRAFWYRLIDWLACRLASVILTDTRAHADYFSKQFGIVPDKLRPVLLGTMMTAVDGHPLADVFVVHFHGSNIPLQGISTIWEAARMLSGEAMEFQMIGPFYIPDDLGNVVHHRRVLFEDLPRFMARAHVCLGIFGSSEKAMRVIPNKVYEALACERPVITADTPAVRELLSEENALLIPASDARALAEAIRLLMADSDMRTRLALSGSARLRANATPAIVGTQLLYICERLSLRT